VCVYECVRGGEKAIAKRSARKRHFLLLFIKIEAARVARGAGD